MIEALWSVEFGTNSFRAGAGVVVIETCKALGGDGQYFYVGKCEVDATGTAHAEITVTHYSGQPNSVFGPLKKFTVQLSGKADPKVMELHGHLVESPNQKISAFLTRRAELP